MLSNLFLTWNIPLVVRGWGTPLPRGSIPPLPSKFDSKSVHARISALWEQEKHKPAPSLTAVILRLLRSKLWVGVSVSAFQGFVTTIARPLVLRAIINELEADDLTFDEITLWLSALGMTVFVEGWLGVLYRHLLSEDMGTTFLTGTFALLLEKITALQRIPKSAAGAQGEEELGTNDVANLIGNDIMKRFRDFLIASNLPMAIAAFTGGTGTLLYLLGYPALAGVGCMVVMTLINLRISQILGGIEGTILTASDARIGILTEIVASIKNVKFFAWEKPYFQRLLSARTKECERIRRFRLLQVPIFFADILELLSVADSLAVMLLTMRCACSTAGSVCLPFFDSFLSHTHPFALSLSYTLSVLPLSLRVCVCLPLSLNSLPLSLCALSLSLSLCVCVCVYISFACLST